MFTTGQLITKTVHRKQYKYYKKIIYIASGHPSGCFNLAPDLRKSTMSMPPRPEYGVLPYRNEQRNRHHHSITNVQLRNLSRCLSGLTKLEKILK